MTGMGFLFLESKELTVCFAFKKSCVAPPSYILDGRKENQLHTLSENKYSEI